MQAHTHARQQSTHVLRTKPAQRNAARVFKLLGEGEGPQGRGTKKNHGRSPAAAAAWHGARRISISISITNIDTRQRPVRPHSYSANTYVEVVDGDVEDETDVVLVDVLVLDDVVVHALALSSISCIGL